MTERNWLHDAECALTRSIGAPTWSVME